MELCFRIFTEQDWKLYPELPRGCALLACANLIGDVQATVVRYDEGTNVELLRADGACMGHYHLAPGEGILGSLLEDALAMQHLDTVRLSLEVLGFQRVDA